MSAHRLDGEERRRAIVEAAVPLFARKGFAGATTKEIAEAAAVSEALVFKHFPSKAALYEAILQRGCEGDPALERFVAIEPSTGRLIDIVHYMLRYSVQQARAVQGLETRHRLMINSFLEDGEYARLVLKWVAERIYPKIAQCLQAAAASGDLVDLPTGFENRFWFGHHLAVMLAFARLPSRDVVPYGGPLDALIEEAAWFILRGFGVKDEVIAAHGVPAFPGIAAAAG